MAYCDKPMTLRLTAHQRKVLSQIVDGALDAGACKGGLTKLESNALNSVMQRLVSGDGRSLTDKSPACGDLSELADNLKSEAKVRRDHADLAGCISESCLELANALKGNSND